MHRELRYLFVCLAFILIGVLSSFSKLALKKGNRCDIQIEFTHSVGAFGLLLDSMSYKTPLGQEFTVSKLKYYVGNFELISKSGRKFKTKGYFLIDEYKKETKKIVLSKVPENEYASINFIVGVDSASNCSGAMSGALDPINGMFWDWNSGYIFLKFEGHSDNCSTPSKLFEYHIGGYIGSNNCIRKIELPLENFNVSKERNNLLSVNVDLLALLGGDSPVNFTYLPAISHQLNGFIMADKFKSMFQIINE